MFIAVPVTPSMVRACGFCQRVSRYWGVTVYHRQCHGFAITTLCSSLSYFYAFLHVVRTALYGIRYKSDLSSREEYGGTSAKIPPYCPRPDLFSQLLDLCSISSPHVRCSHVMLQLEYFDDAAEEPLTRRDSKWIK